MDRNGKLPTKGNLLLPMLADILSEVKDWHDQHQRELQTKALAVAAAAALEAAATPPDSIPNADATTPSASLDLGGAVADATPSNSDRSAAATAPAAPSVPPAAGSSSASTSLREAAHQFGAAKQVNAAGLPELDMLFAYRLFRHSTDAATVPKECAEMAALPLLRQSLVSLLRFIAPLDVSSAFYICALISNLCGTQEARAALPADDLLEVVFTITASYWDNRRMIHLALMTIATLATCPTLTFTPQHCAQLNALVMPLYAEAAVVEAWCCAICNVTALHQPLIPRFVELKVTETIQRLLLFFGDDSKVVSRGLQLLSNLSATTSQLL